MAILTCDKVTMAYQGADVVKEISLTVEDGDYLCIVGENGSGKSTLMKGILGLKKPESGAICFDGILPTDIGYLPQQSAIQKDFPASVYEVVLSGCLNQSKGLFYNKEQKQRAMDNMEALQITALMKKSYRALSGGQQQRVLLARALCAADRLLLLDEPVTGLDPVMAAELYDLIRVLNQKRGMTIIMISHDIPSAMRYGNKILHMHREAKFWGSVEEYKRTGTYARMAGGGLDD